MIHNVWILITFNFAYVSYPPLILVGVGEIIFM